MMVVGNENDNDIKTSKHSWFFHRWRSDIVTASRVSNLLLTLDVFVMKLALVSEPLLCLSLLHFTLHLSILTWCKLFLVVSLWCKIYADITLQAFYYLLLLWYTTLKKLDTLDMILVLVDDILLLRPFVFFVLLSAVSVWCCVFFWRWYVSRTIHRAKDQGAGIRNVLYSWYLTGKNVSRVICRW